MESITRPKVLEAPRADSNGVSRDPYPPRVNPPQLSRPADGRFTQRKPTPSPLQANEVVAPDADSRTQRSPKSSISSPVLRTGTGSQQSSSQRSPRFNLAGELSPPKSPRDRLNELLASEASTTNEIVNPDIGSGAFGAATPVSPKTQTYSQLRNVSLPFPQTQAPSNSPPPSPHSSTSSTSTSTTMRPETRPFPRTSSIDSAISSISTATSHSQKSSQDSLRPDTPDISHLINTAGSAEALIQHLLKEKRYAAAQNAQLWKLVDKQRALVLGLNQDLDRAVKDKERYRKRLKEHLDQLPPLPAVAQDPSVTSQLDSVSQIKAAEKVLSKTGIRGNQVVPGGRPDQELASAPTEDDRVATEKGVDSQPVATTKSGVRHRASREDSTTPNPGQAMPLLKTSGLGGPGQNLLDSPSKTPSNGPSPSSFTAKRSHPSQKAPQFPTVTEATPTTPSDQSSLPFRKLPPAPLDLKKPKSEAAKSLQFGPADHSESEYEDNIVDEIPTFERGRKKTREQDDQEREALALKVQLERSQSKKEKGSKTPSESAPAKVGGSQTPIKHQQISMPTGIKSLSPHPTAGRETNLAPAPTSLVGVLSPTSRQDRASSEGKVLFAPLSPGLPLSPRPGDRPMNSPAPRMARDSKSSFMLSPPLSARGGLPLSPRAPRHPIPLPPYTPSSIVSPMSQSDLRPEPLAAARKPDTLPQASPSQAKQNIQDPNIEVQAMTEIRPKTVRKDLSEEWRSDGVFKGFISDAYPEVLIPPNALPFITVRVISSRLKPSRNSYMASKGTDEEPVFTLGVSSRSDSQELWQVEKSVLSLPPLDHDLKQLSVFSVKLPDRSLFNGHAPTKIDARRVALESYFESILDTPMDDNGALVICRYLSTNVIGARGEATAGNLLPPEAGSPVTLGPDGRLKKEGYLTKRGKNFGGWKARFFVLDEPTLRYYESPGGSLLGTIRLQNAQIGKQSPQQSQSPSRTSDDNDSQYRHAFLILEPKRNNPSSHVRHVLCAESDAERDVWVQALLHYVDGYCNDEVVKTAAPPSRTASNTLVKKNAEKKDDAMTDSPESETFDGLRGVNYDSTVAAQAPVVRVMPEQRPSDSPSPTAASIQSTTRGQTNVSKTISGPSNGVKIEDAGAWCASKAISGPSNGVKIENAGAWGNKSHMAAPSSKEHKKRSNFWGFRDRHPSDASTAHPNESSISLAYQHNVERAANVRPSFGVPLAEAVESSPPRGMPEVCLPAVVYRCLEYLEAHDAASEEGIFRLSGSSVVIKGLRDRFNIEGDFDFLADDQYYDVHAVASLLKLYLRELPSTVLTRELHLKFLAVLGKPEIFGVLRNEQTDFQVYRTGR